MRIRIICAGVTLVVGALLLPSRILAGLIATDCIGGGFFNGAVSCGDPGAPPAKGVNLLQPAPGSPIPLTEFVSDLKLVDVNGDGALDALIFLHRFAPPAVVIEVRPGDGHGSFGAPVQSVFDRFLNRVAVGDVNLDGRPDVVALVTDTSFTGQFIETWVGDGNGQFASGFVTPTSVPNLKGLAVADVTGDTVPDILILTLHRGDVDVWSGNGSGSFTFLAKSTGTQLFSPLGHQIDTTAFALADVNADGALDVLINGTGAAVRYGNGLGSFGDPAPVGTPDGFFKGIGSSIAGADLNGDGFVDIVHYDGLQFRVTLNGPVGFSADTSIYQAVPNPSETYSTSMAIADVDGDGVLDLLGVVAGGASGSPHVSVLFGDGAGGFTNPSFYPAGPSRNAAVGDLNGDGRPDVVAFGQFQLADPRQLTVLLHVSGVGVTQLSAAINALGLPAGTANALQAKVKAAAASRERGNVKATANQLNALINQINALRQSGRLTAAQAASLITLTQQVIAGL